MDQCRWPSYHAVSALLLGKTKDNNASCAMDPFIHCPFIRLLNDSFTQDHAQRDVVQLQLNGEG